MEAAWSLLVPQFFIPGVMERGLLRRDSGPFAVRFGSAPHLKLRGGKRADVLKLQVRVRASKSPGEQILPTLESLNKALA